MEEKEGLTLEMIQRLRAMAFPDEEEQERQRKSWEVKKSHDDKIYRKHIMDIRERYDILMEHYNKEK